MSSRYHGSLIAAWQGSCAAVIVRSEKLDGAGRTSAFLYVRSIETADDLEILARAAVRVERSRLLVLHDRANATGDAFFAWLGVATGVRAAGAI